MTTDASNESFRCRFVQIESRRQLKYELNLFFVRVEKLLEQEGQDGPGSLTLIFEKTIANFYLGGFSEEEF